MPFSHDDRCVAAFAADFRPDFGQKLPLCAAALDKKYGPDNVRFRAGMMYTLQWWGKRKTMILNTSRLAFQTLGLDVWRDNVDDFTGALKETVEILELPAF